MKILVSAICFINHHKLQMGSEIYATYANRMLKSAMEFTNFDVRIATNRPDLFQESLDTWPDRFSLLVDTLENNQVAVGPFNQLLKFFALKDIPTEYDYVLYLDCDAGFFKPVNDELVNSIIQQMETEGCNGMASRAYPNYLTDLLQELSEGKESIFSYKFRFYNVTKDNISPEWVGASLPSEHILFYKNDPGRIQAVSDKISEFNDLLETQVHEPYIRCAPDMEAFEIGISSKLAGYKFKELDCYIHNDVFCVKFNGSNWEEIKL